MVASLHQGAARLGVLKLLQERRQHRLGGVDELAWQDKLGAKHSLCKGKITVLEEKQHKCTSSSMDDGLSSRQ
jgi:hypothetical protein